MAASSSLQRPLAIQAQSLRTALHASVLRRRGLLAQNNGLSRSMATSSDQLVALGEKHVTKGLGRLLTGVIAKGEGSHLHMHDGRKMLDFSCGIGVTNLGHCHPKVSKAAADQCMNIVHGQCSIAFHEPYLRLIERLIPVMPDPSLDSFFFWNSGSEAVEASIKMARLFTGKQNIIAMQGGYHGRTFGAMGVTRSKTIYSEGNHPLMPGVFTINYPYWHHFGVPPSTNPDELAKQCLYQLELLLLQETAAKDTAAILIEPVLGEGGYVPAPASFLKGVREICDKHGILLIIDEVQSGFGRTGSYFSIEKSGVRPDMMTMAKGLANGFPLSGVVTRKELSDKLKPGSLGGTYAGNAVACAAAVACAEVMQEERILDNVNARSQELFKALNDLHSTSAGQHILDVRGQGLMVGIEFASPSASAHDPFRNPSAPASIAARTAKRCIEKGMIVLTTSVYDTLRFIPPLNISQEDMQKGCEIFGEALTEVVEEGKKNAG